MYGRHGADRLTMGQAILLLVLGVVSLFTRGVAATVLWVLQLAVLAWMLFRMFSRNHAKRAKEDLWFANLMSSVSKKFGFFKQRLSDRSNKYFRCPRCRARLRVPKGRGVITVTCPKCGNRFDKRS